MKKINIIICLLSLSFYGCQDQKKEIHEIKKNEEIKTSVNENKIAPVKNDALYDFLGKYIYKDSANPNENLLLVLKKVETKSIPDFEGASWEEKNEKGENVSMTLAGLLYGNTDLFEEAREGYAPGFFVVNVQVEPFNDNSLKVNVTFDSSDVLENPVQPPIESTKEALRKGNKNWEITEMNIDRELIFEIKKSNELILKSDFNLEDKIFKRINL
ncbi:hypothetical protein [Flavobacterium sp. B183]|uniref:hypothetical protein n=1 Tax=Flavobacterium sp. B183 TaxID=907046 RepID=UPI00201F01BB|nr:hypothetical protein [Flavobacterium sp. B183]URC12541.1 hypothetical protein M4I44_21035 [Flavobacterium sp. B183]